MNDYDFVLREERNIRSCVTAIKRSNTAMTEILKSIQARIEREHEEENTKAAELKAILSNPASSETVKKMAAIDFEEYKSKSCPKATAAERAAFNEELENFKQAHDDLRSAHGAYGVAVRELKEIIEKSQAEIRSALSSPFDNWIASAEKKFEELQ